jgi:hypothetical protein
MGLGGLQSAYPQCATLNNLHAEAPLHLSASLPPPKALVRRCECGMVVPQVVYHLTLGWRWGCDRLVMPPMKVVMHKTHAQNPPLGSAAQARSTRTSSSIRGNAIARRPLRIGTGGVIIIIGKAK